MWVGRCEWLCGVLLWWVWTVGEGGKGCEGGVGGLICSYPLYQVADPCPCLCPRLCLLVLAAVAGVILFVVVLLVGRKFVLVELFPGGLLVSPRSLFVAVVGVVVLPDCLFVVLPAVLCVLPLVV